MFWHELSTKGPSQLAIDCVTPFSRFEVAAFKAAFRPPSPALAALNTRLVLDGTKDLFLAVGNKSWQSHLLIQNSSAEITF